MWHCVEVVLTDVSEERIASIFRVEGKIRKSAREASVRDVKSRLEAILSSETSVNTTSTRCHISEDCFLQVRHSSAEKLITFILPFLEHKQKF
jgi:hypothetical protein